MNPNRRSSAKRLVSLDPFFGVFVSTAHNFRRTSERLQISMNLQHFCEIRERSHLYKVYLFTVTSAGPAKKFLASRTSVVKCLMSRGGPGCGREGWGGNSPSPRPPAFLLPPPEPGPRVVCAETLVAPVNDTSCAMLHNQVIQIKLLACLCLRSETPKALDRAL